MYKKNNTSPWHLLCMLMPQIYPFFHPRFFTCGMKGPPFGSLSGNWLGVAPRMDIEITYVKGRMDYVLKMWWSFEVQQSTYMGNFIWAQE